MVKPTTIGQRVLYTPERFEKQQLRLADQLPAIAIDGDTHPTLTIFTGNEHHPMLIKRTVSYKGEPGAEKGYWEEMQADEVAEEVKEPEQKKGKTTKKEDSKDPKEEPKDPKEDSKQE